MKQILVLLGAAAVLSSCATVRQNVDARTALSQCRYELAGIRVTGVQFSPGLLVESVSLEASVKVTNTAGTDVALDRAVLSFSLDRRQVLEAAHNRFVRVAPGASVTEPVAATLPFSGIVKTLGRRPETLGIRAQLWVTLLVGKDTWETPLVLPLEAEVPVPYDQIDAFAAAKKKELEAQAAAEAQKAAEAAKNALPSVPSLPSTSLF